MLTKIPVCCKNGNLLCIVHYTNLHKVFLYQIDDATGEQIEKKYKEYDKVDIDAINKDFGTNLTWRDIV